MAVQDVYGNGGPPPDLLEVLSRPNPVLAPLVWYDGPIPDWRLGRTPLPPVEWRKLPQPRYTLIQRVRIGLADWLRWLADKVTL